MQTLTFEETQVLVTETCCNCGVLFAFPEDFKLMKRRNHETFHCPNGHAQHYAGKSEAEKLRDRLSQTTSLLDDYKKDLQKERIQKAAVKGQLTKLKNRVKNGVCPCCKRSFVGLKKHIENKHPEFYKKKKGSKPS